MDSGRFRDSANEAYNRLLGWVPRKIVHSSGLLFVTLDQALHTCASV